MHAAVLHHRVNDRRALARFRKAGEEPFLFADRTRADQFFDEVVVDLDHAVAWSGMAGEFFPQFDGVVHGDGQWTGRQIATSEILAAEFIHSLTACSASPAISGSISLSNPSKCASPSTVSTLSPRKPSRRDPKSRALFASRLHRAPQSRQKSDQRVFVSLCSVPRC